MKKIYSFLLVIALLSCSENLLEKPDKLIPEDKMVEVLKDLAIVNAAKSTNIAVLHANNIEPMVYIFNKYDIDSLQFVESDRYYASLPVDYARIYKKVEFKLEKEAAIVEDAKMLKDSLARMEREAKAQKTNADQVTDSLP